MKILLNQRRRTRGFVLLLVLMLVGVSIFILAGVMNRTSTVSLLNNRNTQLNVLDNAAEAAVEKVFAKMAWDFQQNGPGQVTNNMVAGIYGALAPSSTDNPYWGNFTFTDPSTGTAGKVYVGFLTNYTGSLPTQFTNQFAYNSPIYRISANVTTSNSLVPGVVGTAQEDVLLALVPITTYAIFYNGQLEFTACAPMRISGRVHSNTNICVGTLSSSSLVFTSLVTSVGSLSAPLLGGYTSTSWTPGTPSTWSTTFQSGYRTNNPTVNIAIQMTNTHSIIDIPPVGEDVMSQQGQIRLYNQARMLLLITNYPAGGTLIKLILQTPYNGALAGADLAKQIQNITNIISGAPLTNGQISLPFLTVNKTFADQRQNQSAQLLTEVDVNQLTFWLRTNNVATNKFTSDNYPTILYVADQRNIGSANQSVVRLTRATSLPYNNGLGFTVATQNPLYVWGNYNTTLSSTVNASNTYATALGSTLNGASVPAALLCDAITILSPAWSDALSGSSYGSRNAATTMTFNAALVTGNVPTTGTTATTFSGGVHNLTRFLENWSAANLVLNTSIVVLFSSQIATNQFQSPGIYYNPPTRLWGFDETYYSPNKQPPGVPCALVPIRFNWQKPPPGSVN
ncbi:MAG: hypothetical protein RL616_99 [Verrucomicrobiota bacterium]|jgi:hypothetical protein